MCVCVCVCVCLGYPGAVSVCVCVCVCRRCVCARVCVCGVCVVACVCVLFCMCCFVAWKQNKASIKFLCILRSNGLLLSIYFYLFTFLCLSVKSINPQDVFVLPVEL